MQFNTCDACGLALSVEEKSAGNICLYRATLQNNGSENLTVTRAFFRAMLAPGPYEYYVQTARWSAENQGCWQDLNEHGILLGHKEGRTTCGNTPYLAMRLKGFPQTLNFHILPEGNWRIRVMPCFFNNNEPEIAVDLGMRDEELSYTLAPGESWVLPEITVHKSRDFDSAMPELHDFLYRNMIGNQTAILPVLFNTWFDRFDKLDTAHLRDALQCAREIGCETFVIDAGWFGSDNSWGNVGDWREKTHQAFCGRMKEFADEVRSEGLKFGIWMEPERYVPAAPVMQQHPEWFVHCGLADWHRMDLTVPAAREHFKSEILRLIETYNLEYIKLDMNSTLGSDDSGRELNEYQKLFLNIIDEVKTLHPETVMENCASGALRSELTTLKHFDVMFPSDNVNAFTMLGTIRGLWRRYLPGRIIRWSTMREIKENVAQFSAGNTIITPAEATFEEYERTDLESLLIANFTGGSFSFSGDIASLTPANRALVKKYVDLYKSRRSFLMNCSGRWLADTERLQAFELEKDGSAIVVLCYIASDQAASRTVYPQALDAGANYKINGEIRSGSDIMENGLNIKCRDNSQHHKWRAEMVILDKE